MALRSSRHYFYCQGTATRCATYFPKLVSSIRSGERIAFFPEGTTSAQGKLQSFHANLLEAAIDAGVPVQPYALRYLDCKGDLHFAPEYIGDTTFLQSMLVILRHRDITAELLILPEISSGLAHRRDLAIAARESMMVALDQVKEIA
jgi:1-acyl-sn-glycerol-3-phosphate acyltransferase